MWPWLFGLVEAVSGISLLVGFLTPAASVLVGISSLGIALASFTAAHPSVLDSSLATAYVVVMAAAVAFLGPGAFSVDARLFGRREIIISHTSKLPKI